MTNSLSRYYYFDIMIQISFPSFVDSCELTNIDYEGHDIKAVPNILTSRECSGICRGLSNCRYWSWLSPTYADISRRNTCHLKTSNAGREVKYGVISGNRDCNEQGEMFKVSNFKIKPNLVIQMKK